MSEFQNYVHALRLTFLPAPTLSLAEEDDAEPTVNKLVCSTTVHPKTGTANVPIHAIVRVVYLNVFRDRLENTPLVPRWDKTISQRLLLLLMPSEVDSTGRITIK